VKNKLYVQLILNRYLLIIQLSQVLNFLGYKDLGYEVLALASVTACRAIR